MHIERISPWHTAPAQQVQKGAFVHYIRETKANNANNLGIGFDMRLPTMLIVNNIHETSAFGHLVIRILLEAIKLSHDALVRDIPHKVNAIRVSWHQRIV